jgi:Transposase IS66 family
VPDDRRTDSPSTHNEVDARRERAERAEREREAARREVERLRRENEGLREELEAERPVVRTVRDRSWKRPSRRSTRKTCPSSCRSSVHSTCTLDSFVARTADRSSPARRSHTRCRGVAADVAGAGPLHRWHDLRARAGGGPWPVAGAPHHAPRPADHGAAVRRCGAHLDREWPALFSCLPDATIDATNWRAEQALRPAVVNRKVPGGNRTWLTVAPLAESCLSFSLIQQPYPAK